MTPERWARVKEILGSVLEKPGEERAAFLDYACGADEGLRRVVETLLAQSEKSELKSPVEAAKTVELKADQILGRYRVETNLGQGGMGAVYKAYDNVLHRPVALKVLTAWRLADPESKQRLMREARAASALDHPNIVTIYDIDQADGIDFIAMEYVPGKTLDQLIPRKGLRLSEALKCAVHVADALAAAHAAGIVHRDIKPSNIVVSDQGQVKVLDFGLAKRVGVAPGEGSAATAQGVIAGTAAYMSPEQAQGEPVDARSDIFSFGGVLYEMVTGRRAFPGDNTISTIAAILHQEPAALGKEVPREVATVITRCLRKEPTRRYQHMDDVKIALEELKEESDSGGHPGWLPITKRLRRKLVWAAAPLTVLVAVVAWYYLRPEPVAPLTAVPLTTYPGSEEHPAFSPDGSQVAFSWNGEKQDNFDIYVRPVEGGTPNRITTDPALDTSPEWSPNGSSIAFLRLLPQKKAAVIVIPALGGTERTLAEVHVDRSDSPNGASFLSWSRDSKHLAIVDRDAPGDPTGLFILSLQSKDKRRLISPPAKSMGDSDPAFSPDGRSLAFSRSPSYVISDLHMLPLSADLTPKAQPMRLTFDNRQVGRPAWTPDGRQIVFSSSRLGRFSLWRLSPAAPGKAEQLQSLDQDVGEPAISRRAPGGIRLAYSRLVGNRDIWRADLSGPAGEAAPPFKFVASTRDDHNPKFSPDGRKIAFTSDRSGSYEIWVCASDGSNAAPVTSFGGPLLDCADWSPDGRFIACHSRPEGQAEIYVVNSEGGQLRRLTNDPAEDIIPRWSRDGRWIYFGSNRTGRHQVWKMPAEGGSPVQVTKNGGIAAAESPDGKHLYYTKVRGMTSLWRMPLNGEGPEVQILESVFYLAFELRPEGVYYVPGERVEAATSINFLSFTGRSSKPVLKLGKGARETLTVSPDGRTLLYSQVDEGTSDLMLVENFR